MEAVFFAQLLNPLNRFNYKNIYLPIKHKEETPTKFQ